MSYTAWSVVFGEVPSETKWNILGANDDSFNDGTGIADDAIVQRHFADNQIDTPQLTSALIDFKELARETLTGTATSLEVAFTAKKYLRLIIGMVTAATNVNCNMRFNGDSGANYAERYSSDHGAGTESTGISGVDVEVGASSVSGASYMAIIDIFNPSGADKTVNVFSLYQNALTQATIPAWTELEAMWNSTAQVSSIVLSTSQLVAAGSELIVLGHD